MAVGTLALTACGDLSPAEQAQMDALVACSDKATAEIPVLSKIPEMDVDDSSEEFRVDSNGAFIMTASVRGERRPLSDDFICQGNLNERTIAFVEFNGVRKRPPSQEVWKF